MIIGGRRQEKGVDKIGTFWGNSLEDETWINENIRTVKKMKQRVRRAKRHKWNPLLRCPLLQVGRQREGEGK